MGMIRLPRFGFAGFHVPAFPRFPSFGFGSWFSEPEMKFPDSQVSQGFSFPNHHGVGVPMKMTHNVKKHLPGGGFFHGQAASGSAKTPTGNVWQSVKSYVFSSGGPKQRLTAAQVIAKRPAKRLDMFGQQEPVVPRTPPNSLESSSSSSSSDSGRRSAEPSRQDSYPVSGANSGSQEPAFSSLEAENGSVEDRDGQG